MSSRGAFFAAGQDNGTIEIVLSLRCDAKKVNNLFDHFGTNIYPSFNQFASQ